MNPKKKSVYEENRLLNKKNAGSATNTSGVKHMPGEAAAFVFRSIKKLLNV